MTPEQLDEIEKLANAATPGPWNMAEDFFAHNPASSDVVVTGPPGHFDDVAVIRYQRNYDTRKGNAAFIAAAREDVPALLAEVRRLMALLERRESALRDVATHESGESGDALCYSLATEGLR